MHDVFLSYRRDDAAESTGWLYSLLIQHLGHRVFCDIEQDPGVVFNEQIRSELMHCKVFIAVIGRNWLLARDGAGRRRLDQDNDLVRLEVETALTRAAVDVIPLLVNGAQLPKKDDLPAVLQPLTERQTVETTVETFTRKIEALVPRLGQRIGAANPAALEPPASSDRDRSFETLLSNAQSALSGGEWANAIPFLQAASYIRPDDPELPLRLRWAHRRLELA